MSNKNQNLVDFFREAVPYIHGHRGKTFVIAISGEVLKDERAGEALSDIAILSTLGARVVLVHGARPQIDEQLTAINHQARIHKGLRITDKETLAISKSCIGAIRLEIENHIHQALNRPPVISSSLGIISGNFLTARPLGVIDGVDYQHTGKLRKTNLELLNSLLDKENIILASPLGYSPTGQIYNIRYEEIAGHLSTHLGADKLIFLHNKASLTQLPRHCNLSHLDKLLEGNSDTLLNEISKTMHDGIERVHLIDIKNKGSLLLELYTRDGAGNMLSTQNYDEPRQANANDVNGIIALIRPLEAKGTLVKRSRKQLELDIQKFCVIERDGLVIGCAALYPIKGSDMGELSCLAIHDNYRSGNRGDILLEAISNKAQRNGLKKLLVLTTQSLDWFLERGFETLETDKIPQERLDTYNTERNSKVLMLKITQKP